MSAALRPVLTLSCAFAVGAGIGLGYFRLLQKTVHRWRRGQRGSLLLIPVRLLIVSLPLFAAASLGASVLLVVFGGFLLSRALALRLFSRSA